MTDIWDWVCSTVLKTMDRMVTYVQGVMSIPERLASVQFCWPQIPHELTEN